MAFHTRSSSLPTKSNSFVLNAETELLKLNACLASSPLSSQMILNALEGIRNTYECINGLLCMSSNVNNLSQQQERRQIDQELGESINLLDICSTSRDNLGEIKTHIQDLESVFRRCGSEAMKSQKRGCFQLVKKSCKDVKKHASRKSGSIKIETPVVLGLLREVREITISVLESLFSYLSEQIVGQKTTNWTLISSTLQIGRVPSREGAFDISSLRVDVERLEDGLECLFRCMIQCRVSLLNICSS